MILGLVKSHYTVKKVLAWPMEDPEHRQPISVEALRNRKVNHALSGAVLRTAIDFQYKSYQLYEY